MGGNELVISVLAHHKDKSTNAAEHLLWFSVKC